MTVYLVWHLETVLWGVYSTREKAQAQIDNNSLTGTTIKLWPVE